MHGRTIYNILVLIAIYATGALCIPVQPSTHAAAGSSREAVGLTESGTQRQHEPRDSHNGLPRRDGTIEPTEIK